ncbi:DUF262 domain-containing protein [Thermoleophilia bacterium SCSIO 60948]|nr:DUF262 domain-containing protein [Thermoleophilia bacterium SCSIO 60948]
MKADTRTLQTVFQGERQFVVPVYQRPYVWVREKQWEPLWDDIEATAIRLAEARKEANAHGQDAATADQSAAPHFLGALVIEDQPVMTGDVDSRLVVDGQQRLTTLQLLLRGVLDAIEELGSNTKLRARLRKVTQNDDEVVSPSQLSKVSPRVSERPLFEAAMNPVAPPADDSLFAAGREFFASTAADFLADGEIPFDPFGPDDPIESRANLLVATLLGLVKLVVIDLEDADDAQVIFEALNARNTPLSATDLVKNLLFLRAQALGHNPEELYEGVWRRFDDESVWWLQLEGTGHAQRARQDWLLGDWLIAQTGRTINVGRLYGEFRRWLDESGIAPFEALETLGRYADAYEALNGRREGPSDAELTAFRRIQSLNITVAMPVMLWLFVETPARISATDRERAVLAIESFVIRRMAAKMQTRGYGPVFVEVLAAAQASEDVARGVIDALRGSPAGYVWPALSDVDESFRFGRYYGPGGMNQERLRLLLGEIDRLLQSDAMKSESLEFDYPRLQVEHVIPQKWREHWPVETTSEARPAAELLREQHVNRIGNLTLTNDRLNPAMGNDPWEAKRAELEKHSKLELNAALVREETWNEDRIQDRGTSLAIDLERVWPGPEDENRWGPFPPDGGRG